MGKMKELFMKQNYPNGDWDLEREYLIDDILAQEQNHLKYLQLQKEEEMNVLNTKIEVAYGTTIEVDKKDFQINRELEKSKHGF